MLGGVVPQVGAGLLGGVRGVEISLLVLVLFQLISRPSADVSSFMSSKHFNHNRDVVSKVQICEHFLTQAPTYEASVNGTAVCYWIITTRQNAGNEQ